MFLSKVDVARGLDAAKALAEKYPKMANSYLALSFAYNMAKLHDDALATARKGLEIDSSSASLWDILGSAHDGKKDYSSAISAFRQAIKLNPTNSWTWNNLASSLLDQGSHLEAMQACFQATKLDPHNSSAYGTLARIHAKLGDMDAASEAAGKAAEVARSRLQNK